MLSYLIFLLPLSRPDKNLVLGVVCALAALAVYQMARRDSDNMSTKAAPVAIVTVMILPFLAANKLLKLNLETIYIWMMYIMLYIVVSVIWVKKHG